uniref:C-type lectin domain-containing protein n=1 Tax=Arion vulgaris TaxID=1028688 RepID=A0A0B6ZX55_9EUPU
MIRVVLLLALTFQCVVSDEGCPLGWRLFQEHCYGFFAEQVSWNLAASSCHVYNSYLTKIERAAENDWIVSVLKSLKCKYKLYF